MEPYPRYFCGSRDRMILNPGFNAQHTKRCMAAMSEWWESLDPSLALPCPSCGTMRMWTVVYCPKRLRGVMSNNAIVMICPCNAVITFEQALALATLDHQLAFMKE